MYYLFPYIKVEPLKRHISLNKVSFKMIKQSILFRKVLVRRRKSGIRDTSLFDIAFRYVKMGCMQVSKYFFRFTLDVKC